MARRYRYMATCEVCGNDYDKAFRIHLADGSEPRVFDSFECAIHALAPACAHCGCTVLGHGVESDGITYCCAHCAHVSGVSEARDRADTAPDEEPSARHRARGGAGGARRARPAKRPEHTVGISKQSGADEARDQESLPERGHARE
jgi:hypothetical protein